MKLYVILFETEGEFLPDVMPYRELHEAEMSAQEQIEEGTDLENWEWTTKWEWYESGFWEREYVLDGGEHAVRILALETDKAE